MAQPKILIIEDERNLADVLALNLRREGFEVLGAPDGSPANLSDWERSDGLAELASVTATEDTLLFGFGLEQLASDEARVEVVARMLAHFGI